MQPDTEWSEPGETAGKPDRYQSRWLRGCHLSAGSNGRHPDGRYIGGDSAPWMCSIDVHSDTEAAMLRAVLANRVRVDEDRNATGGRARCVRWSGVVQSQHEARKLAEIAAVTMSRRLASMRGGSS